jgi:hypothetical protein
MGRADVIQMEGQNAEESTEAPSTKVTGRNAAIAGAQVLTKTGAVSFAKVQAGSMLAADSEPIGSNHRFD